MWLYKWAIKKPPQNKLTASDSLCIFLKKKIASVSLKFGNKNDFFYDANCRISQGSVDAGTTSISSINSLIQYENDRSVFIAQNHGDGLQYNSFVTTNSQSEKKNKWPERLEMLSATSKGTPWDVVHLVKSLRGKPYHLTKFLPQPLTTPSLSQTHTHTQTNTMF